MAPNVREAGKAWVQLEPPSGPEEAPSSTQPDLLRGAEHKHGGGGH